MNEKAKLTVSRIAVLHPLRVRSAGDPVFQPDGYDQTFAELSKDIKNKISHRARAIEMMKQFFEKDAAAANANNAAAAASSSAQPAASN